jgi:hypothetical protein
MGLSTREATCHGTTATAATTTRQKEKEGVPWGIVHVSRSLGGSERRWPRGGRTGALGMFEETSNATTDLLVIIDDYLPSSTNSNTAILG